jgi:hypothetical protein
MAVSALRALAVVQWHSSIAINRKQMGQSGSRILIAFLLVLSALMIVTLQPGVFAIGYFFARQLPKGDALLMVTASLTLSCLSAVLGVISGAAAGSTRQLPWNQLRAFPLSTRTLFWAEFFANAADPITAYLFFSIGLFCLGACVGAPLTTPIFLLLFLTHTALFLALKQVTAGLMHRFMSRLKLVAALFPVLAFSAILVPLKFIDSSKKLNPQFTADEATKQHLASLASSISNATPTQPFFKAAACITTGAFRLEAALPMLVPMLGVLLLVALSYWMTINERETAVAQPSSSVKPLWSFTKPYAGIARLQMHSLLRSRIGIFGLLSPLLILALIRYPMARFIGTSPNATLAAFGYAALTGMNLVFNQFGLDRHGIKVLLLMPVSSRTLLLGKWLGFALWQAFQAVLLSALLFLNGQHDVVLLATGLIVYACAFFGLSIVGQFCSIWQPRPLNPETLRRGQPSFIISVLMVLTVGATSMVVSSVSRGVGYFAPGWEPAALIVLLLVLAGSAWALLPFNAAFLNRHKERLVETLSSSA